MAGRHNARPSGVRDAAEALPVARARHAAIPRAARRKRSPYEPGARRVAPSERVMLRCMSLAVASPASRLGLQRSYAAGKLPYCGLCSYRQHRGTTCSMQVLYSLENLWSQMTRLAARVTRRLPGAGSGKKKPWISLGTEILVVTSVLHAASGAAAAVSRGSFAWRSCA